METINNEHCMQLRSNILNSIALNFNDEIENLKSNNCNWRNIFSVDIINSLVDFYMDLDHYYRFTNTTFSKRDSMTVSQLLKLFDKKEIQFFINESYSNIDILINIISKILEQLPTLEEDYKKIFYNSGLLNNYDNLKILLNTWKTDLLKERSKHNNFILPTPKHPNKIYLYHIDRHSKNNAQVERHIFKPCIPETATSEDEDQEVFRICFSSTIIGCINGIGGFFLDEEASYNLYIMEVDKNDERLSSTKFLMEHGLVYDAYLTNEVWWREELTLQSTPIQFLNYKSVDTGKSYIELEKIYEELVKKYNYSQEELSQMDVGKMILDNLEIISNKDKKVLISYDLEFEFIEKPVINKILPMIPPSIGNTDKQEINTLTFKN